MVSGVGGGAARPRLGWAAAPAGQRPAAARAKHSPALRRTPTVRRAGQAQSTGVISIILEQSLAVGTTEWTLKHKIYACGGGLELFLYGRGLRRAGGSLPLPGGRNAPQTPEALRLRA